MFHILMEDDLLFGKGNSYTKEGNATPIFCKTETPREAISLKNFKTLANNNRVNKERCCKVCYAAAMRKVGRPAPRASEEAATSA